MGSPAEDAGWGVCAVVDDAGVVAGRLRVSTIDATEERTAEELMDLGPSTVRPHQELAKTLADMDSHHLEVLLVTTPEGRLLGAVRRSAGDGGGG